MQNRSPRKKWATKLDGPHGVLKRHTSEAKVFQHVRDLAAHFGSAGSVLTVTVLVDEGLGRGWETFERMPLADVAPPSTPEGN